MGLDRKDGRGHLDWLVDDFFSFASGQYSICIYFNDQNCWLVLLSNTMFLLGQTKNKMRYIVYAVKCLHLISYLSGLLLANLLTIFNWIQHFYHILLCLRKPQGRGLELARKHVTSCLSELASIYKSLEFLRSISYGDAREDIENSTTASGCRPVGFDVSLNSKLSAPTPPRAIRLLSWKKVSAQNCL